MVFRFTNQSIISLKQDVFHDSPEFMAFEERCEKFLNFLDTMPSEIDIESLSTKEWFRLSLKDYAKANEELQKEANNRIYFIWLVSSFKINKLLKEVLRLFNEGNFFPTFSLIRSIMETVCFTNYVLSKAKPMVYEINKNTDNFLQYQLLNTKLEEILLSGMKSTRIKLVEHEFSDTIMAEPISNAIKHVSKNEKYKSMNTFYGIMCEYVHPNMFSYTVFGTLTKMYEDKDSRLFKEDKILGIPGEMDKYYLNIPERESFIIINYFGMFVNILTMNMNLFEETVNEFKELKIDLLKIKPPYFDLVSRMDDIEKQKFIEQFTKDLK